MTVLAARIVARYLEGIGTPRGWEHRKERDEAVERDIEGISPHLRALWRKLKHQFKGSPARRVELFLEYVHEHPDEGMELLQDKADRDLAKMIKDQEHQHWKPSPEPLYWEPGDDGIPF